MRLVGDILGSSCGGVRETHLNGIHTKPASSRLFFINHGMLPDLSACTESSPAPLLDVQRPA